MFIASLRQYPGLFDSTECQARFQKNVSHSKERLGSLELTVSASRSAEQWIILWRMWSAVHMCTGYDQVYTCAQDMIRCTHVHTWKLLVLYKRSSADIHIDEDIHQAWIGDWHASAVAVLIKVTATLSVIHKSIVVSFLALMKISTDNWKKL